MVHVLFGKNMREILSFYLHEFLVGKTNPCMLLSRYLAYRSDLQDLILFRRLFFLSLSLCPYKSSRMNEEICG